MPQPKSPRLPLAIRATLAGTDWHWINGSKHWKLIVNGKMVAVWPKGMKGREANVDKRSVRNAQSQIRNAIRRKAS